jgi:tRNA-binding EMAP/Myf-like protein
MMAKRTHSNMELTEQLQELGVTVGRIVAVADHVGARAPSYLLTVDVGPQGRHECSVPRSGYEVRELEGTQIVCARRGEELVVLAAHSHARGIVFLRPDRDVEDGSIVG